MKGVLVDVSPLRLDPRYRRLWLGQTVSGMGTQITRIALPFQVYVLTGSTLAVAALAAVQLVPILTFALGAGSLADAIDRRRLLLVTQTGQGRASGPRMGNAATTPPSAVTAAEIWRAIS